MGTHSTGMKTNETTVIEASPGRVLALQRPEREPQHLLERWSYDGGVTWSEALRTAIWGYPVDLTKLRDGRILCSFGYRRDPKGIRAVLSSDGGVTWDTGNPTSCATTASATWAIPARCSYPTAASSPSTTSP